jgi:hypothetical protein
MNGNTDVSLEAPLDTNRVIEVDDVESKTEPSQNIPQIPTENAYAKNGKTEEFRIQGDELVAKVKTLIHEGNIRRIIVKNETGHTLIEIPLTVGVVGGVLSAALFPVLAAVGAIGAVVAHLTLVIDKRESDE